MGSRYEEHRPRHAPGRFVACVWTQRNRGSVEHRQLVVPDGCADLVWQDGAVRVVGPDRGAWVAPLAAGTEVAGIRLRPGAAPLLLGRLPAEEVRDLQVPLADVLPVEAGALAERLAAAGSAADAAALLDAFVGAAARDFQPDEAVSHAVALLRRGDVPRLAGLADGIGLSERQLRRRFTDAVGYGPKSLHGILRFQRALDIGRGGAGGLADVAYAAGYADQAHFTREVRRLAGTTPSLLLGRAAEAA